MKKVGGSALPTVIVISLLMAIIVLAVISYHDMENFMFNRLHYIKERKADVESGHRLLSNYPDIVPIGETGTLQLYDGLPESEIKITKELWGLYELLVIQSSAPEIRQVKLLGLNKSGYESDFYYTDQGNPINLTGNTTIKGEVKIPRSGLIYGQLGSVFYHGENIEPARIAVSADTIHEPKTNIISHIRSLKSLRDNHYQELVADSISHSFFAEESLVFQCRSEALRNVFLKGNIIILGDNIHIDSSTTIEDVVIVCDKLSIGEGFSGSLQAFVSDSLLVGKNAVLKYPSGLYAENYMSIGEDTVQNGYVIVNTENEIVSQCNFSASETSTIRGFLYTKGFADLGGIINAAVFIDKATHYTPEGYYNDMIFNTRFLNNDIIQLPLWIGTDSKRGFVKNLY